MTLLALESWDGIATADLAAKGWTGGINNPAVSAVQARTGGNSLRLTATASEAGTGKIVRALGAGEHATVVVGGAFYPTGVGLHALLRFLSDSAATTHISIAMTAAGTIEARRGVGTGTILGTSTVAATRDSWNYIEARVTLSDTVGVVEIRLNGATILNLTNQDTKNAGTKTTIDSIALWCGTGTAGELVYWDDVYVVNGAGTTNNTPLGDLRVRCLLPSGNGNSSQLVGSDGDSVDNYALVNETPPSTANYVGSGTLDQKDTYAFGDLPDASGTVHGVQISALATKTDSAARNLALVTRSGGSDFDGSDVALALSTNAYVQQIRETDPATAAAWTLSGVNSAEFGAKVR